MTPCGQITSIKLPFPSIMNIFPKNQYFKKKSLFFNIYFNIYDFFKTI